jgi:hypothetical protein
MFHLNKFKFFSSIGIILIFILHSNCRSIEEINPDDVEFTEAKQEKFYKLNDKRNQDFIDEIRSIQEKHVSFVADFTLRIDRYAPNKDKFYADGRLYFSKDTGMIKIQLMDNFFGLVFSQVLASPNQIQVKSAQDERIHTQGMDDLNIYDPGKKKNITIPFPVIYYSITGDYLSEFKAHPSYFSPNERRVLVKKKKEEYIYVFDEDKLSSLEWIAEGRGIKAVAKTGDKPGFPPTNLVSKIIELENDKETVLIITKLRNVRKMEPSPSVFKFQ